MQSLLDQARVLGIEQIYDFVCYDSNSKADDDDDKDDNTFQDAIQEEDDIDDTEDDDAVIYGEILNNNYIVPVGPEDGATRVL